MVGVAEVVAGAVVRLAAHRRSSVGGLWGPVHHRAAAALGHPLGGDTWRTPRGAAARVCAGSATSGGANPARTGDGDRAAYLSVRPFGHDVRMSEGVHGSSVPDSAWAPPVPTSGGDGIGLAGYSDFVEIARGGDSVVYRARQNALDRFVAVKTVDVEGTSGGARFSRELEITLGLGRQHPHIVTVLDTGTTADGRAAIVMEYHELGSLHDRLTATGPLPVADVVKAASALADALDFAHSRGILHRDVKPQNVLVLPTSYVLADFGIARMADAGHTASLGALLLPARVAAGARRSPPDRGRRHLVAGVDGVHAAGRAGAVRHRRPGRRHRAGLPRAGPSGGAPRCCTATTCLPCSPGCSTGAWPPTRGPSADGGAAPAARACCPASSSPGSPGAAVRGSVALGGRRTCCAGCARDGPAGGRRRDPARIPWVDDSAGARPAGGRAGSVRHAPAPDSTVAVAGETTSSTAEAAPSSPFAPPAPTPSPSRPATRCCHRRRWLR